jgi:hypothetical protein
MSAHERAKLEAIENLWKSYSTIYQNRGIDLARLITDWTTGEVEKLPIPGARLDFWELCDLGCRTELLVAIIALVRLGPEVEKFWKWVVGGPYQREKLKRDLERAARTLDQMFDELTTDESEQLKAALARTGQMSPGHLAEQLRMYAGFATFAEYLSEQTSARSFEEGPRYLLVAYVKNATGNFHDRQISSLFGSATGSPEYGEEAQRMWRLRNYSRLDASLSTLADLVTAVSVVLSSNT